MNYWLVEGTGIPLLVTACFDISRFSGVVTLKSPGGVFAVLVFPIRKHITVLNLFSATYFVGDLFVLPRALHVNLIN